MIPRYQRILFAVLLGSSILMAAYLIHLHHKRMAQLAALSDATPISAPYAADAETVTLAIANDADGTITASDDLVALPTEPGARTRALLEHLLATYTLPQSTHPLAGGPSIDDVFLLPAEPPQPKPAEPPLFTAPDATDNSDSAGSSSQLAVINLHGSFVQGHPSGVLPEMLTLQSILGTLHANLPQITKVRFLVDGQQAQTLAGHVALDRIYTVTDTTTSPAPSTPATTGDNTQ